MLDRQGTLVRPLETVADNLRDLEFVRGNPSPSAANDGGGLSTPLLRCALALLIVSSSDVAEAQELGIELHRYRAAESPSDGFSISRPDDIGHLLWSAQIQLDYGYDPLLYQQMLDDGTTRVGAVVEHMLVADLAMCLGVAHRVVVFFGFPFNLVMTGQEGLAVDAPLAADGTSIGDFRLGARARVLGSVEDLFSLGVQATLTMPTATWAHRNQNFAGDGSLTGHFELSAEIRPDPVRITVNVGARSRHTVEFLSSVSGSDLTWGLGISWSAIEILDVIAEIYGSSPFTAFGDRESTPIEAIGGLRLSPGRGFVVGIAAGAGLTPGIGSPRARMVLTFGWLKPPPPAMVDHDGDGLVGDGDRCPFVSEDDDGYEDEDGCPELDNDGDGVSDEADRCPNEAEDEDQFQDGDGCPELDNDSDGILDHDDLCPIETEDLDQFEDGDGCPDLDNDRDGLPDSDDECPIEPEDIDEFEDGDGCADSDNDQDGVVDVEDRCPLAPGRPELEGCPETIRLDPTQIRILQRVRFASDQADLHESATPILEEVAAVLQANPRISRVVIEGHTDSRSSAEHNRALSQRRAESVVSWLIERGIDRSRLVARGRGETEPVDTNSSEQGRRNNRRVEFLILEIASDTVSNPREQ